MAGLVCVCKAGSRVYVFEVSNLYECQRKEYEMAHLAWDIKCELGMREELWGWEV